MYSTKAADLGYCKSYTRSLHCKVSKLAHANYQLFWKFVLLKSISTREIHYTSRGIVYSFI